MDKKTINIILISVLCVLVLGFVIFLIFKPTGTSPVSSQSEQAGIPYIAENDMILKSGDSIQELQQLLLSGCTFIGTSADGIVGSFEFRDDGVFKGYTKDEADDLGTWEVVNNEQYNEMQLIIKTSDSEEEYLIGYNNNDDITIANEAITFVLSQK